METRVDRCLVTGFAGGRRRQGIVEELHRAARGLLAVFGLEGFRELKQGVESPAPGHHQIPQVAAQGGHEMQGIESLRKDLIKGQQRGRIIPGQKGIHQPETELIIKDIEVTQHIFILHLRSAERDSLVEDGQGVAHGAIGLQGNDMQGLVVDGDPLFPGYGPQIAYDIRDTDPVEIVSLAT